MGYIIERISEKNFNAFLEIFEASFGKPADKKIFQNKFNTSYTGTSNLGFIAFDEITHAPAAFYGVFPTLVMHQGKVIRAAQSGDTATHPDHRKKGLFNLLHTHTIDLCKSENICFVYGFPNENSYPGFLKFGWSHTQNSINSYWLNRISLPKKIFRKLAASKFDLRKLQILESIEVDKIRFNKIDISNSLVTGAGNTYIERNPNYLNYKTNLGSKVIELNSGFAWITYRDNELRVGDLFGMNLEKLLDEISELCLDCGFDLLSIKSSHQDLFKKFEIKYPVYKKEVGIPLIIKKVLSGFELNDENLAYTGGDYDTFEQ